MEVALSDTASGGESEPASNAFRHASFGRGMNCMVYAELAAEVFIDGELVAVFSLNRTMSRSQKTIAGV